MNEPKRLCCIADDFTGASDIASFFSEAGLRTLVTNGIPEEGLEISNADIVVIALKTRTEESRAAVEESSLALEWAINNGFKKYYFKYCSTFDSTSEGNIGPVADMMMEVLDTRYTVVCPSLPVNGRTVKDGILYVNGIPLSESPMKNHPLTPMTNSNLRVLLGEQSKYPVVVLDSDAIISDKERTRDMLGEMSEKWEHFYVVPDYFNESHGKDIADYFDDLLLYTGGSGLAAYLGKNMASGNSLIHSEHQDKDTGGSALIVAGSCSTATLGQIESYIAEGLPYIKVEPQMLVSGLQTIEMLWGFILAHVKGPVLVFSSDTPENIRKAQEHGSDEISRLLEGTVSLLAKKAVDHGIRKIIVAGGETSGAVTMKLGYRAFAVGRSVAPGVPVMVPIDNRSVKLVLKSGNFGSPDFFTKAIKIMEEE